MYWIAVASKEHVMRGVEGGFAQVCHGKVAPLKKMKEGDWIIYYSPTEIFGKKEPYQKFTALGQIQSTKPYLYQMSADFTPWRRDVCFLKVQEVKIAPLINQLNFIQDKKRWGYPFRFGFFSISEHDFHLIASSMDIFKYEKDNRL